MRQFIKFVFASCLGSLLALGLIVIIFLGIGLGSTPSKTISKNSILKLSFDHPIPELTNNVTQGQFTYTDYESIGLNDIEKLIRHAISDDNIQGIVLTTESTSLNPTLALSVSKLIKEFAESGKYVGAYGKYFTQSGYLLATEADSIFLNPNGSVDMRGYGYVIPYFKDFSEKSKINFDVYYAGLYKSAIEPYYLSSSSDANRFQTRDFLNQYQEAFIEALSQNREIDPDNVQEIIYEGLSNNADDALELGLVDQISYWSEFESHLKKATDITKPNYVNLEEYYESYSKNKPNHDDKIAIVYAEGEVAYSTNDRGKISMERYGKLLDRIKRNKKIKAVVLRVNSPGGSSLTSDLFWNKIEEIKDAGKYVIASFGNYAASGGYYIACGADKIVSQPTTLTGSIGVFSMIPDLSEFFDENIGIDWDTIGTGKRTFIYSTMIPRSASDHEVLMKETERIYMQFKGRVADGRDLSLEEVEEIAKGRVWSGNQGVEIGLVDTIGGLDDAVNIAAELASLDEYKVLEYPIITKTFYEQLLEDLMTGANTRLAKVNKMSGLSKTMSDLLDHVDAASKGPQARLPFLLLEQ